MIKRVKKLCGLRKRSKSKNKGQLEKPVYQAGSVPNINDVDALAISLNLSQSCHNVKLASESEREREQHNSITLRKKAKKHKRSKETPEGDRKFLSKSTGDLSKAPATTKRPCSRPLERVKGDRHSCSRTSVTSVEALRENRLSVISQLDEYIDHVKRSVDDGNIAYAPNRLCCAQLLKMVYQRREQQHLYNSLHPSKHSTLHGTDIPYSKSSSNILHFQNSSSLPRSYQPVGSVPNFNTGRVRWKQGTDSESSSTSEEYKGCLFSLPRSNESSDIDENEEDEEIRRREHSSTNNMNTNNTFDSNHEYEDYNTDDYHNTNTCHGDLKNCSNRKSVPLFPQHFDIY